MAGILGSDRAKVLLAIVFLAVAGGLICYQLRGGASLPDEVNFVCAASGRTFDLDRNTIAMIPAKNPKTGERTLLPCYREEDGVLRVSPRYREQLLELGETNQYVDVESLAVQAAQ